MTRTAATWTTARQRPAPSQKMPVATLVSIGTICSLVTYPMPWLRLEVAGYTLPYFVPLLAVLAGSVAFGFRPPLGNSPFPRAIVVGGWLYVTGVTLSTLAGTRTVTADTVVRALAQLGSVPLLLLSLRNCRQVGMAVLALFGVMTVLAAWGYYGFLTGEFGNPAEHALGYWGLHYTESTRNSDALYVVIGATLSGAFTLFAPSARWRTVGVLPTLAMGLAVALSLSRGAWLSLAIAWLVLLSLNRSRLPPGFRAEPVLAALAFLGAGVCLLTLSDASWMENTTLRRVGERLLSFLDPDPVATSNLDRLRVMQGSVEMLVAWPVGVGLRTTWAENDFLNVAVELGLIGLAGLVTIESGVLAALVRRCAHAGPRVRWDQAALLAAGAALVVNQSFNVNTDGQLFWIVLGMLGCAAWEEELAQSEPGILTPGPR